MEKARNFLTKLLTVATLAGLGLAYSAKADQVSFNSTVYYAGPAADGVDNKFGVVNPIGNPISGLQITSAGAAGALTFNSTTGVTVTGADFTVNLVGSSAIVSGTTLQTGSYTFASASDYFGLLTAGNGATTGFGCNVGQTCNFSANPQDIVTINVAANGVITLASSSLELVTSQGAPPSGVPEIDPKNAMTPLALLAGVVMIMRGRRKKIVLAS